MKASTTSCLSSDVLGGLLDELEKISEASRGKKLQRWLKNTAIIAAGTGAGTGAMMVTEKVLSAGLGPHWAALAPTTRKLILGTGIGVASTGATLAAKKLLDERGRLESD